MSLIRRVKKKKKQNSKGRWWLTPTILATQEAEIRSIAVQRHLWKIL
jgi:hypothetical protein